jgi:hypothetical protein
VATGFGKSDMVVSVVSAPVLVMSISFVDVFGDMVADGRSVPW